MSLLIMSEPSVEIFHVYRSLKGMVTMLCKTDHYKCSYLQYSPSYNSIKATNKFLDTCMPVEKGVNKIVLQLSSREDDDKMER